MDALTGARQTSSTAPASNTATTRAGSTSKAPAAAAGAPSLTRQDSVRVSGQALVTSRLFNGHPMQYTPGAGPASGTIYGFLTSADRALVADAYEFAQDNGIGLDQVDRFAADLGEYRSTPPGVQADGPPTMYDENLQLIPIKFGDADEAAAQRILTSKAVKDSAVPEDFLRHELTPASGMGKAADFSFVERFVYATSPTGSDGARDPQAVLELRSADYYRSVQAARGEIHTPAELRRLMAGVSDAQGASFETYAHRVPTVAAALSGDDKNLLASLYQAVETK